MFFERAFETKQNNSMRHTTILSGWISFEKEAIRKKREGRKHEGKKYR